MRTEVQARPHHTPILRRAVAGLVVVIVAALAIKIAIGFVMAIFWTVVAVAAVVAVLWALKTLIW
jgi:hypothetical protein